MKRSKVSVGILGVALIAASCSPGGAGDESAATTVDTVVTVDPIAVPQALDFTAPAVGGGQIDAASFAGKPTVFWFWAPT